MLFINNIIYIIILYINYIDLIRWRAWMRMEVCVIESCIYKYILIVYSIENKHRDG